MQADGDRLRLLPLAVATFASTETLPWFGDARARVDPDGVPEVVCLGSPLPGGSPPQLLT